MKNPKKSIIIDLCKQLNLPHFLVVYVGADGGNEIDFEHIASICEVHAVEPRMGSENTLPNLGGFGNFVCHNTALSDKIGPQTLYVTEDPYASSLLKPNLINIKRWRGSDRGFKVKEEKIVDCETLDSFSKKTNITKCDFIKLDTQGTELNILLSGMNLVSNTSIISMEIEFVRLYQDQYLFDDVVRELSKMGFRYVNFTHGHSLGSLDRGNSPQKRIWSDTLFLRDTPGKMKREEILKAAIILYEMGYEDEAIWFMQDHGIAEENIAQIANSFRKFAMSEKGFIIRKLLFPIYLAMRNLSFPGRLMLAQTLTRFPFMRALRRNGMIYGSKESKD